MDKPKPKEPDRKQAPRKEAELRDDAVVNDYTHDGHHRIDRHPQCKDGGENAAR